MKSPSWALVIFSDDDVAPKIEFPVQQTEDAGVAAVEAKGGAARVVWEL